MKSEESIPTRFEQQVRQHGQRLAIKTRRHTLSYDALNQAANRLAHTILAQRGPGAEPVALLFDHDAPLIVAMLAVLKAGKFYVPLDPLYPRARTAAMLEESQAELIVTDASRVGSANWLAGQERRTLDVDHIGDDAPTHDPRLGIPPAAYAYVLFTSGSTGRPKGVVESHRNVLHFTKTFTDAYHVCPDDRLSLLVSCCFAISTQSIYGALLNGASLHPFDLRSAEIAMLADWLIREEVTFLFGGAAFKHLVRTLTGSERFPRLRLIHYGGQTLFRRDAERYKRHFADHCVLVNSFGATEKRGGCLYFIDKQTPLDDAIVPVGYPVPDTEIALVDDRGAPVPVGEVGEIELKSRYLAPGFWRQPELTRATFRPAPEGGELRIWRTGDLGRLRPDGALVHLGRKDALVKIRGHRVELGEIEAALLELPGVAEAVVAMQGAAPDDQRLVAYVVTAVGRPPSVTELRAGLETALPAYMLPSVFMLLDALPRTPNGKMNRLALPNPGRARPNLANAYVEPRTPTETLLARIWTDLLDLERVGVHDNLLELGGDSLLTARLIARVGDALQRDLPLERLFRASTVAEQAAVLQDLSAASAPDDGQTWR